MAEVERLLTASLIEVVVVDPDDDVARLCLRRYFAELDGRFETGSIPPAACLPTQPRCACRRACSSSPRCAVSRWAAEP